MLKKKSPSLVAFASILKQLLTSKVAAGENHMFSEMSLGDTNRSYRLFVPRDFDMESLLSCQYHAVWV